jgi:hypothetical protein
MRLFLPFISILVIDLGIDTSLGLIFDPFPDEKFVLRVIEITALTFTLIANPMSLKVITVTLCEHTITVAFALVPLAFVDIFIRVDHATFALGQSVHPVAIVPILVFVEKGTSSVFFVLIPVTGVLTAQLASLIFPVSTLAMALIDRPHTLVFVTILVKLDTKAFFAVIAPVADVLLRSLPFFALNCAIFGLILLFDPVN